MRTRDELIDSYRKELEGLKRSLDAGKIDQDAFWAMRNSRTNYYREEMERAGMNHGRFWADVVLFSED